MKLISLGWDVPPGFTHPINGILATAFKAAREPSQEIGRLLERLQPGSGGRGAAQ